MGIWKEIFTDMGSQPFAAVQPVRNQVFTFAAPTLAAAMNAADSLTAMHHIPAFVIDRINGVIYDSADPKPVTIRV